MSIETSTLFNRGGDYDEKTERYIAYHNKLLLLVEKTIEKPNRLKKIAHILTKKFLALSNGLIALDNVSEISGLILFRALTELAIDFSYLCVMKNKDYIKRYDAFNRIDGIKIRLGSVPLLDINSSEVRKRINLALGDWKNGERLISKHFKEQFDEATPLFTQLHTNNSITEIEALRRLFYGLTSWRPYKKKNKAKNIYDFSEELFPKLKEQGFFEYEQDEREFHNLINQMMTLGNSAVHSSDTLVYQVLWNQSNQAAYFDLNKDKNPGQVLSMCSFSIRLMIWSLQHIGF